MNPNSTRSELGVLDLQDERNFPLFIKKLSVSKFRNISNLELDFVHPITVITGTNKIGKTSILTMLACSHVQFQMKNQSTGEFERCTWSRLVKFTKFDLQADEWKYKIVYKRGNEIGEKEGKRSITTKKWSGVAKRESQIEDRKVIFIDVDRITPARSCSNGLFTNTQLSGTTTPLHSRICDYFNYILERSSDLCQVASYQNKTSYKLDSVFSSFNSASGEDVLLAILTDIVNAEEKSLILIDELELGLHPSIQRRLVDVIMDISLRDKKQFILTTHSPFLLSSFDSKSRIFIEKDYSGNYKARPKVSVNVVFSKMDSEIFPLLNLFCEDKEAKMIINKVFEELNVSGYKDIHKIINVIDSGTSSKVKENYDVFKRTWNQSKMNIGYAAVFDGDQRSVVTLQDDDKISFLFSNEAPEKFLLRNYLQRHKNEMLEYHLNNSDPHILFNKCIEEAISTTEEGVFNLFYEEMLLNDSFNDWLAEFKRFLIDSCNYFSEKL